MTLQARSQEAYLIFESYYCGTAKDPLNFIIFVALQETYFIFKSYHCGTAKDPLNFIIFCGFAGDLFHFLNHIIVALQKTR